MKPSHSRHAFLPTSLAPSRSCPIAGARPSRASAPRSRPAARIDGFTLPELVTTVAIVAVLAVIAQGTIGGAVHAARAAQARSALLDTYRIAIGHAATRGVHVVACPARDGACVDAVDWSGGWLLFVDADGDRQRDAGERMLSSVPPLAAKVHLRSTVGRKRLVFQPTGGNAGSNVTFTLCDGRGADAATQLVVANDGRLHASRPSATVAARCMADP